MEPKYWLYFSPNFAPWVLLQLLCKSLGIDTDFTLNAIYWLSNVGEKQYWEKLFQYFPYLYMGNNTLVRTKQVTFVVHRGKETILQINTTTLSDKCVRELLSSLKQMSV